jgi:hypothetical protein
MMDILDRDDDAQRHCDADQAMGLRPSACFVQLGSVCQNLRIQTTTTLL